MACGQAEERVLLTGLHAVADIYCECCKTPLGWKYVSIMNWDEFVDSCCEEGGARSVVILMG